MCGIAFLYNAACTAEELQRRMTAALSAQKHRGPDDGNQLYRDHAISGHRRLSIIDLDGSRQPMTDPEERYLLSFNGEIYNYAELRHRLSGKWHFRTQGDTEVVLAGLVLEGREFLNSMEGMWALALWDCREHLLLLSRDRLGKKPLYFQTSGSAFGCASELPALKQLSSDGWKNSLMVPSN